MSDTPDTSAPVRPLSTARSWMAMQALWLVIIGGLLLWVFQSTDIDRQIAHLFFDEQQGVFPLRRTWLFEDLLHHSAKQVTYLAVAAALYVCYLGYRGALEWLPPRNALLAALGMLLIPLGIATLKVLISRHCPWDMVDFGGYLPYLHLLDTPPTTIQAGACFPAGHASTGLLWIVWGVALRPAGRSLARLGLLTGLLLGGVLGIARMAQGAHFLSHTLWSFWFAWAMSLGLAHVVAADLRLGAARERQD
ncbi:MAG: phosphatase PAP2 family protein [Rhodocyclaceae bacterium]|nr:phosphatase PAP2 family protein [Rhodocyclaceae bacterium]